MTLLSCENISLSYKKTSNVLHHLSLSIEKGEITTILGKSGCGKSTLLRCIAGFEPIQNGHIRLNNITISSPKHHMPPHQRHIGLIFQEPSLFGHLNIEKNITFGLKGKTKEEKDEVLHSLLGMIKLTDKKNSYPHELSGGQQQRVALARALAVKPRILLCDEAFSSLDPTTKDDLCYQIKALLKKENISTLMITHTLNEATIMSDSIGIMSNGHIQHIGPTKHMLDSGYIHDQYFNTISK